MCLNFYSVEHTWASRYTTKETPPLMKDQLTNFYMSKNQFPFMYG
jgi:hypothetical protein